MSLCKTLLLVFLSMPFLKTWSQTQIRWSPDFSDGLSFSDAIYHNGKFYTARVNANGSVYAIKNRTTFVKYDWSFQEEATHKEQIMVADSKAALSKFLVLNNNLYAILRQRQRDGSQNRVFLNQIDTASLELHPEPINIFGENPIQGHKNFREVGISSPNHKFLLFLQSMESEKGDEQFVNVKMFDESGGAVLDTIYELGVIRNQLWFSSAEVDDLGNFHFISYSRNIFIGEGKARRNILGRFSMQNRSFQTQRFEPIPNYHFAELMVTGNGQQICVGGFYFGRDKNDRIKRPVLGIIDINSTDTVNLIHKELPLHDITEVDPKDRRAARRKRRKNSAQAQYMPSLRRVLFWDENTVALVSENYGSSTTSVQGGAGGTSTISALGDIKIGTYNTDGELLWKSIIGNLHGLHYDSFNPRFSFLLSVHHDELRILLDNVSNKEYDRGLLMIRVDRQGTLEYYSPNAYSSERIYFSPLGSHQLSDSQYFVMGRKGFRYKYGVLEVE